jgi:S-adenosylmethionine decarboxylase
MKRIYGLHLLADGYVKAERSLSPGHVVGVIEGLVPALGMQILVPPQATRVKCAPEHILDDEDDGGWSVFCQITTSHIALHGWPLRRAFMMDIFSCKPFNAQHALQMIYEDLGVQVWNTRIVEREDPTQSGTPPPCLVRRSQDGGFVARCKLQEELDEEDTKP